MPTYIRVKDLPNAATSPAADDFILLSGAANGARRISRADFLAAVAGFYTSDPSTYKLATLDAGNKVLVSQLPSSAFSYQGTWAASTNTPSLANGTGTGGDTYYASDSGSVDFGAGSISFLAGDAVVYDGSVWQKVPDVVNLLDGKGTLDEAKTTLEIPDVGTAPNEVPMNGQLGTMAYQSAEAVSVANAEVETLEVTDKIIGNLGIGGSNTYPLTVSKTGDNVKADFTNTVNANFRIGTSGSAVQIGPSTSSNLELQTGGTTRCTIDSAGRVGIGSAPAINLGNGLSVDGGSGYVNLNLVKGSSGTGHAVDFSDENGALQFRVGTNFSSGGNNLIFARGTGSTIAWKIDSATGNLVANSTGIDFGSGASTTLNDYEEGVFTPVVADAVTGGNVATVATATGRYTKIGRIVQFSCLVSNINTTGLTGGNILYVRGLPFDSRATDSWKPMTVLMDTITFSGQVVGIIAQNQDTIQFKQFASGSSDSDLTVSAVAAATADIHIQGVYEIA